MRSTRSARRAETQKAKKERMQRQRDRAALFMPVPPRPASQIEQDMLSLFGSIMHGVHYAKRQVPTVPRTQPQGQWLLTDALYESPDALKPENILPRNNNAGRGGQDRLAQLSDAIADAANHGVDPQVLFFLDLMVKAEKAVAQAEETRGSPINHLSAYLKALKRDITPWADRKFSEDQNGSNTDTPDLSSSNSPSAAQLSEPQSVGQTPAAAAAATTTLTAPTQPKVLATTSSDIATAQLAAEMPPPLIRSRGAQPQRKTIQTKEKRSLIVRLKVPTAPEGNNPLTISSGITNAAAQSNLASSDVVTSATPTASATSGLTIKLRPNAGKPEPQQPATTIQSASGAVATASKRNAADESTPQVNASPQQESANIVNEPVQPSGNLSEATGSSVSGANKRKAPTNEDADDDFVPKQPTKRRRVAAPQSKANKATSKAPRTNAVKKSTKTAKPCTPTPTTTTTTAAAAAAAAPSTIPAPAAAPAPAPGPTATPAAPQLRSRNGSGPVTGRDGFELIGREPRFTLGQNDAHLLTLHFYRNDDAGNRVLDSHTWKGKTDNRTPADIDWTNAKDIKILNKWVLQYLNRTWKCNGLRPDMMARVWMDEEFEWLAHQARHYRSWSKKDVPSLEERRDEFNEEWEGEQIPYMNVAGEEVVTMPRPYRTEAAIQSAARRDEEVHPARWVGTYLEGRSEAKKNKKNKKEKEEEEL